MEPMIIAFSSFFYYNHQYGGPLTKSRYFSTVYFCAEFLSAQCHSIATDTRYNLAFPRLDLGMDMPTAFADTIHGYSNANYSNPSMLIHNASFLFLPGAGGYSHPWLTKEERCEGKPSDAHILYCYAVFRTGQSRSALRYQTPPHPAYRFSSDRQC